MHSIAYYYFKKLLRTGPLYHRLQKKLAQTQYYSTDALNEFQNAKLRELVNHCYQNVPYYTDIFNALKLKPDDIQTKEDLAKLPFLDRYIVKENYEKLIAKNSKKLFCKVAHTSGSTGTPGKFLRDLYSINYENAVVWRHWRSAGDTGLKRISFKPGLVIPITQSRPPFWEYDPTEKELSMSSYHLTEANTKFYIDKILEFQPEILTSNPSSANILAAIFVKNHLKYKFKAVFTSSETLSDDQKDFIEDTFDTKITDWYGQAERVAAIGQCEKGSYHIQEDYSIVELVPNNGLLEMVGTSFINRAMPLLRYKTADFVSFNGSTCTCGRNFRVIHKIIGREMDYILTPEGAKISMGGRPPIGVNHLVETQLYQDTVGEVVVKVVTTADFNDDDEALLISNTRNFTSQSMRVIVKKVDRIERGPNGKFQQIVNRLS